MRAQLDFLSKDKSKGFLLVNEIGGKVDFACHNNDGATAFREVAVMDSCVRIAYEFYKQHPDETLIVLTSDHETGGLVLNGSSNRLNLKILANQKCSQDGLTKIFQQLRSKTNNKVSWEQVKEVLRLNMGFWDAVKINEREEIKLKDIHRRSFEGKMPNENNLYSSSEPMAAEAVRIINAKAHISWATGGHSAGLVPVYACGVGAELFMGHNDNATIPMKIARIAGYIK
jgi:alkaline phosphatase